MLLFNVIAKHSPESCPAGDPEMGKMLLSHIHQENASKFGIKIKLRLALSRNTPCT